MKSHLPVSLNLCRTFLSLKTSFLVNLCKKMLGQINQELEYDGGGVHVRNCTRATSSTRFSTCNIIRQNTFQKSPCFTFFSPFCVNYFFDIFPMYLGTINATSKKNQVQLGAFVFPEFSS